MDVADEVLAKVQMGQRWQFAQNLALNNLDRVLMFINQA